LASNKYIDMFTVKRRIVVVFCILALLFSALVFRMFNVMISQGSKLKKMAVNQWTSEVKIDAKRGRILDRNGHELAVSANVFRVDIDMNTLRDTMKQKNITKEILAPQLAAALDMKSEDILKILSKTLPGGLPLGSANLGRRIEKAQTDKVIALNLKGILVSADTKRYYPNNSFAAQTIGHTNSDGVGLTGVELTYNSVLSGTPGIRIAETDKKSTVQSSTISEYTQPVNGKDVILTIDKNIQDFCENAADQAMKDNKALGVTMIVMDPNNGEILAMVNKPDYNLNDPWVKGESFDQLQKTWRNKAVSDIFEPGSIFKIITSTAALETGSVTDADRFSCTGSVKIGSNIIHCWKTSGHGVQTFVDILKNSCNIGFAQVGKMVGKENLNKFISTFGFGKKTGIDLPGEASGIVKKTKDITDLDLATIAFGQTDTVSSIQFITALNAVANGGKWVRPHVMKEIGHYDDNVGKEVTDSLYNKLDEKQILDKDKMATLRSYLEKVVSEGGGKKAFIDGFHIAGKTGTAQKAGVGGYQNQKYISSFAGMAPADHPKFTVLISINEPDPSNYYAGQITAPVAKQIFDDLFNYMAIKGDASAEDTAKSLLKDVVIPEVRGKTALEAEKILKQQNLKYQIDTNGEYVVDINPKPGYTVKEGSKIILYTGTSPNYNKVVAVPDVTGLTKDRAIEVLSSIGLKTTVVGDGMVTEQDISPDTEVSVGTVLTIDMDAVGD